jgi:hypothetical protein
LLEEESICNCHCQLLMRWARVESKNITGIWGAAIGGWHDRNREGEASLTAALEGMRREACSSVKVLIRMGDVM